MNLPKIKEKILQYLKLNSVTELKAWMNKYKLRFDLRTRRGWVRLANVIWDAVSCREPAYPIEHVIKAVFETDIKAIPISVILEDWRTGKELGKKLYNF